MNRDFSVRKVAAPLRQSVTQSIRNAIAAGYFKAGERMPERQLCEMTDVSRTLVREALRQLESEGLIEVIPHRGPIVATVTPEDAEGIYQVREELEGLAARLFAERATEVQRGALVEALEAIRESYKHDDPIVRLDAKNRFYERMIEGAQNVALGLSLRMVNARVMLLRATSLQAPGRKADSLAELDELVRHLLARDAAAARDAATRHVRNAGAAAIGLLRAKPAE